jgi:hypothetical protein
MENKIMDMKEIREAICKHHGGLEQATDGQLLTLWEALDKSVQERYLKKEPKAKEFDNAVRS